MLKIIAEKVQRIVRRHPFLYRLRYWLRLRIGSAELFGEIPGAISDCPPPEQFRRKIQEFELGDAAPSFETARQLAFQLSHGNLRGPGMGVSSTEALQRILSERAGVCSDYSQVFLGLCSTAGIPCREWGVCESLEGSGIGHAFNEVYCQTRRKWIFLDPFCSVWASTDESEEPLSVSQMIDAIDTEKPIPLRIHAIDSEGSTTERREGYLERYFQADRVFFLQTNNDPFAQDSILARGRWLPLPILHAVMITAGVYQRFEVYTNARNSSDVHRRIEALRRQLATDALALTGVAAAVGLVTLSLGVFAVRVLS